MNRIVVFEDMFGSSAVPDALDHTRMVPGVGEDLAPGQLGGEGEQGRVVGHVAGGEDQGGLLLVQRRNLCLQIFVEERITRDVSGSSSPNPIVGDSMVNSSCDHGMGRHAQIVVGTPNCYVLDGEIVKYHLLLNK